jgi:hypothetical protein
MDNKNPLRELGLMPADDMAPPSLDDSRASTAVTSSSRKSDKFSVGPYDLDFRKSLGYRNIYIECKKPLKGLVWRAREIIIGLCLSPEVDDTTAEKVTDMARELQTESKEDII